MNVMKEYKLSDPDGNEYRFKWEGDLYLEQGDVCICVGPEWVSAFMRQLNKFVDTERAPKKA